MLLFASGICTCACSDGNDGPGDDPSAEVTVTINPSALECGPAATDLQTTITADADWSLSADASWLSVFPTGGLKGNATKVTVTVAANNSVEPRTGTLTLVAGKTTRTITVTQTVAPYISAPAAVNFGAQAHSAAVTVSSNCSWTASSDATWCTVTPASGSGTETTLTIACTENNTDASRTATVKLASTDGATATIAVTQLSDVIDTPQGYTLVWNDEFNTADGTQPNLDEWYYEEWAPGYVNNELQRYVAGGIAGIRTADIQGGILRITAAKNGSEVVSARLNTRRLWQYGYFEARLKLPVGKGTWPAFWMMPADGSNWPHCGEIDIMEEVGVNPDYTSSSIHCTAYNHTIGTQRTAERHTPGAEATFHVYALEWTPDYIRTYVDGKELLTFANDKRGDEDTWPFDKPFHPILNLAWGGSWGGMNGVDEAFLPATYEIDYVRVFQKL